MGPTFERRQAMCTNIQEQKGEQGNFVSNIIEETKLPC